MGASWCVEHVCKLANRAGVERALAEIPNPDMYTSIYTIMHKVATQELRVGDQSDSRTHATILRADIQTCRPAYLHLC